MTSDDWRAVALTAALASTSTAILLAVSLPLSWWLARSRSRFKPVWSAVFGLPLVLPPSVLGFYLLLALGPSGWLGRLTSALGWGPLTFSFAGLVVGSVIYSLPFVVQPIQDGFERLDAELLESAATLRAGPWDRFWTIALPLTWPHLVTAAILGFAHTVGEFGVVLMIGGNIPGKTRVLSIAIYDAVESLDYGLAHRLSLGLVVFALLSLSVVQALLRRKGMRWRR